MNPSTIDSLIENLEPTYRDLIFGDFFENLLQLFYSNLHVRDDKFEEASYLLTLYFIFIINRYELINSLAIELNLTVKEVHGVVSQMLDNLPRDLITSIESTYREGITDQKFIENLDKLQALSPTELLLQLEHDAASQKFTATNGLDSNIETEKTPESLHNIRTMSADMNVLRPQAEVIHTASSQADILARPPIAPSNTPVNSPRWDSDV